MQTLVHYLGVMGNLALFLAALGFIVFVHELGHFLTAKWAGVRVTQFAIGFGHAAFAWRKGMGFRFGSTEPELDKRIRAHLAGQGRAVKDDAEFTNEEICRAADELHVSETEYRFNWIPLGGYVKMLGQEDLDPTKVSRDQRSFNNAPIWKRMIIVSAGVTMNVIFAVGFFIAAFMWGIKYPPAVAGSVDPDSSAATAVAVNDKSIVGIQPGDRFTAINGVKPSDFNSQKVDAALTRKGETLTLSVERPAFGDQPAKTLEFVIKPTFSDDVKMLETGITEPRTLQIVDADPELGLTRKEALKVIKATDLPLQPGWLITRVNGQAVTAGWQYQRMLAASNGQPMQLVFHSASDNSDHTLTIHPDTQMQHVELHTVASQPQFTETVPNLLGLVPSFLVADIADGAAAKGLLNKDDAIAQIDDVAWPTPSQLVDVVTHADGTLAVTVVRDGQRQTVSVTPKPSRWIFGTKRIGVQPGWNTKQLLIARVLDDSPFAKSDIAPGSVITAVNGSPVKDWNDLRKAMQNAGESVTLDLSRPLLGGVDQRVTVQLPTKANEQLASLAWFDPIHAFMLERELQKTDSPLTALSMGFDKTGLFLRQTYVTFLRLADRSLSPSQLSGPVGIATIGTTMADRGFAYLFYFAGLISVNLAVVNFLPFPIVDGGLFVMLLIEKARGKPLPLGVQTVITYAGLVFLGMVFLFVTYNDIVRMVGG
ncbi:MAG: site-2 protease family protein [Phycisphaerales bacterium]